jgi:hypothetical protein
MPGQCPMISKNRSTSLNFSQNSNEAALFSLSQEKTRECICAVQAESCDCVTEIHSLIDWYPGVSRGWKNWRGSWWFFEKCWELLYKFQKFRNFCNNFRNVLKNLWKLSTEKTKFPIIGRLFLDPPCSGHPCWYQLSVVFDYLMIKTLVKKILIILRKFFLFLLLVCRKWGTQLIWLEM